MCGCSKGQRNTQNARGRSPVKTANIQRKTVAPNIVNANATNDKLKAQLRRDAIRRAKGG